MHRIIEDSLEDYLAGRIRRDVEAHLAQCVPCRSELTEIESVSASVREAFAPIELEAVSPSAGFYARLSQTLETRKPVSAWSFFSIDAAFGRRVAFASLMTLAAMGGYLVSRESNLAPDLQGPEAIMASHDTESPHDATVDRDRIMVALASYEH